MPSRWCGTFAGKECPTKVLVIPGDSPALPQCPSTTGSFPDLSFNLELLVGLGGAQGFGWSGGIHATGVRVLNSGMV